MSQFPPIGPGDLPSDTPGTGDDPGGGGPGPIRERFLFLDQPSGNKRMVVKNGRMVTDKDGAPCCCDDTGCDLKFGPCTHVDFFGSYGRYSRSPIFPNDCQFFFGSSGATFGFITGRAYWYSNSLSHPPEASSQVMPLPNFVLGDDMTPASVTGSYYFGYFESDDRANFDRISAFYVRVIHTNEFLPFGIRDDDVLNVTGANRIFSTVHYEIGHFRFAGANIPPGDLYPFESNLAGNTASSALPQFHMGLNTYRAPLATDGYSIPHPDLTTRPSTIATNVSITSKCNVANIEIIAGNWSPTTFAGDDPCPPITEVFATMQMSLSGVPSQGSAVTIVPGGTEEGWDALFPTAEPNGCGQQQPAEGWSQFSIGASQAESGFVAGDPPYESGFANVGNIRFAPDGVSSENLFTNVIGSAHPEGESSRLIWQFDAVDANGSPLSVDVGPLAGVEVEFRMNSTNFTNAGVGTIASEFREVFLYKDNYSLPETNKVGLSIGAGTPVPVTGAFVPVTFGNPTSLATWGLTAADLQSGQIFVGARWGLNGTLPNDSSLRVRIDAVKLKVYPESAAPITLSGRFVSGIPQEVLDQQIRQCRGCGDPGIEGLI